MAKRRATFLCDECGADAPQWVGRCPACDAWNTLVEAPAVDAAIVAELARSATSAAMPVTDIVADVDRPRPTGLAEVDRVLGGGLVPGSVTLIGGEPGVGKSTLLTELAAAVARAGHDVLYVSAEESVHQVRLRAERLGALTPRLWLAASTSVPSILAELERVKPAVAVVDSIQTVYDPALGSAPGSLVQVRGCAQQLVRAAKERNVSVVLVGHVTKDGALAGPRVLEHAVDTVLCFEGERHHALRLLRVAKHRFGSTDELGVFEMSDAGLLAVPDVSVMFLADRRPGVPGSVVSPTIDGRRPMLVELQALVCETKLAMPRRSAQGLDGGRLAFLLAVLARRAGVPVGAQDVFALAVGGTRVVEPGADLALALAVASAVADRPVAEDVVACAEVGLSGELRQVSQLPRRLAEAARLGFRAAIVPQSAPAGPAELELVRVGTVRDALVAAGLADGACNTSSGSTHPPRESRLCRVVDCANDEAGVAPAPP